MQKTGLITGATSGFGKACAYLFAENGYRLIITGRRAERLEILSKELFINHGTEVLPLAFDVRNQEEVRQHIGSLPEKWQGIDVLVNNAGLASGFGPLQEGDPDDWNRMIDTNIKGLLYVSKVIMPLMIKRKTGHIINIGSTAGKEVYAGGNIYCATKHAVDAITKGMRIDLLGTGIKVTQIAPGAAETEFAEVRFHGDKERAKAVYQGYKPMTAEDIATLVHYVTTLPPHLCINDLVVTAIAQANSFYVDRSE
jgi:NADP-dependent 3-hydroxy acid dehydrogenase YdfG